MGKATASVAGSADEAARWAALELLQWGRREGAVRASHLSEWAALLERGVRGGVRAACGVGVRHGKTTITAESIARWLCIDPTLRIFYLAYGATFSTARSREIRRLAQSCGVALSTEHNTIAEWRTEAGGGLNAFSTDQEVIGQGADIVVVDDGLGWNDRNNAERRQVVDDSISFCTTRLNPGGSVYIIGSRCHPDDPIGRRLEGRSKAWTYIARPAILDEGLSTERALWPEVRTLENLREIKAELLERGDSRVWESQYQCKPRATVDELFREPTRYDSAPDAPGFRWVVGLDLAYSVAKDSDWFALVVAKVYGSTMYVTNVVRVHASFPVIEERMRVVPPGSAYYSYVAGPEHGAIRYFYEKGLVIQAMNARFSKRTRAQKTIDAWNAGNVRLPTRAPWLDGFMARVKSFTGAENDSGDDEIDALVSAHDGSISNAVGVPHSFGSPRM